MSRGKRIYPRLGLRTTKPRTKRSRPVSCELCGKAIAVGEYFAFVDVQHDWFRGNDDVVAMCMACDAIKIPVTELLRKVKR